MKVVAVLETDVSSGGGFNQALTAIRRMSHLCQGQYQFAVLTTRAANLEALRRLGFAANCTRVGLRDRLLQYLATNVFWLALQNRLRIKGAIERRLERMRCDLAYFVVPSALPLALQEINYIATIWDLCHRDWPEFPEVRAFGEFQRREAMLNACLPAATTVIADSPELAENLIRRYRLDAERVVSIPFSPAPELELAPQATGNVVEKYALAPGYFFYPAQLWPHKNHLRLIEAMALLRRARPDALLVFVGGDKGGRKHLDDQITRHGLGNNVRFLGFVPGDDLAGLYRHCRAVAMPTYFGPTNLPPLEAWLFDKPLIYSSHLAEQVGDAALLIDGEDPVAIAAAMEVCYDADAVAALTHRGRERLRALDEQRTRAESLLMERLRVFARKRRCWS